MVQRDYVRRKSQSKNNSRIMPKFMILIAMVLIILFSVILYVISTNNQNNKLVEQPKKKTEPPTLALPEQPQERWTYLKELETPNATSGVLSNSAASERQQILDSFINNNLAITSQNQSTTPSEKIAPTTQTSTNTWLLQCGAFKDKSNADTLRAKIAMLGISSNISLGQLYRVTAGPYTSKTEADKAINSLKNNGINNCIVSNK